MNLGPLQTATLIATNTTHAPINGAEGSEVSPNEFISLFITDVFLKTCRKEPAALASLGPEGPGQNLVSVERDNRGSWWQISLGTEARTPGREMKRNTE